MRFRRSRASASPNTRVDMRAHCDAAIGRLQLPDPFSVRDFCKAVENSTGTRIALHSMPVGWAPAGLCGLLIETDDANHIYFTEQNSLLAKATAILHECGHILIPDLTSPPDRTVPTGLVDVPDERIRAVHGRTGFSERIEATVELFASMVLDRGTDALLEGPPDSVAGRRLQERFG